MLHFYMIQQLDNINPKGNRCVFTIVNYDDEDEQIIQRWAQSSCKYFIYGREVAPSTRMKHLQGYMHLLEARYRRTIIAEIQREGITSILNYLQPAKGFYKKTENIALKKTTFGNMVIFQNT